MPKLQGLIFDLDGTLVDSAPDLRHALNKTLVQYGRDPIDLDTIKRMVGDGMLPLMRRAFEATGAALSLDDSYGAFQTFVTYYRAQTADPEQLYPLTLPTLDHYRAEGVKFGLCTNKQEEATLRLLRELGLFDYFTFIAGGDTFEVHKPHPGHVKGVIDKLGVAASGCVMIGDSANDVRAAQGAGIPCLVVTHGYGLDVAELGADGLIAGFNELAEGLRKLGFDN